MCVQTHECNVWLQVCEQKAFEAGHTCSLSMHTIICVQGACGGKNRCVVWGHVSDQKQVTTRALFFRSQELRLQVLNKADSIILKESTVAKT